MWQVHFELDDGSVQSADHSTWESALKEACGKLQTLHYILDPRGQRIGRDEIVGCAVPYRTFWDEGEEAQHFRNILEATGPENVRALMGSENPHDYVMIRGEKITVGFAHEWLAWHDRQKAAREIKFRNKQIFWARTALVGAVVGAIVTWLLK